MLLEVMYKNNYFKSGCLQTILCSKHFLNCYFPKLLANYAIFEKKKKNKEFKHLNLCMK